MSILITPPVTPTARSPAPLPFSPTARSPGIPTQESKEEKKSQAKITKVFLLMFPVLVALGTGIHLSAVRKNNELTGELERTNRCVHALDTLPNEFTTYDRLDTAVTISKKKQKQRMKAYIQAQHETQIVRTRLEEAIRQNRNSSSLITEYRAAQENEKKAKATASLLQTQMQTRDQTIDTIRERFERLSTNCPLPNTYKNKLAEMNNKHPTKPPRTNKFKHIFR